MTDKSNSLTKADRNRAIRQEGLREVLSKKGHLEHVVDLAQQIEKVSNDLEAQASTLEDLDIKRLNASVNAKKIVIDTKMRIINKYLGDVKSVEHSGEVKQVVIDDKNQLEEMLRAKGIDPESIRLQ
jgi:hypothetical protein